jgi:hypothetical protein
MSVRDFNRSRVLLAIAGVMSIGGGAAVIYKLYDSVRSGHGLQPYIAVSGQEWMALPALIFMVIAVTILVVGGVVRLGFDAWEERSFIAALRKRLVPSRANGATRPVTRRRTSA